MGTQNWGSPSGEHIVSVGTEAWNIADGYTKIKILRLLIEIDLYETVATFGYKDFEEKSLIENDNQLALKRIEGLQRVLFCLKQLLGNCRFSLKEFKYQKAIEGFYYRLNSVESVIIGIAEHTNNDVTKEETIKINEEHFKVCFEVLRDIKDTLNFPINEVGLIFRKNDEVDLDKIMNDIVQGG